MTADLINRVRGRLASSGTDLTFAAVAEAVRDEASGVYAIEETLDAVRLLEQELVGAGLLEPLLHDPAITDVLVFGDREIWVDGTGGLRRTGIRFADEDSVRRLATRLALTCGRRLDDAQPFVDAWLPASDAAGRVRLHAVLPPIAADGTCLSLRILRPAAHDLSTLESLGTFDAQAHAVLRAIVDARLSFLISGGTGSGKTTLLAAMLAHVPHHERIVSIEDAGELQPDHPQFVRLIARPPNIEGAGEITLSHLVRQALRMRPDRLVVGEVRGPEIRDLLTALNTGHEGGAGTIHANSPTDVPARIEALAAQAGLPREATHTQLTAALHLVLHMRRTPTGARHLTEIGLLTPTSTNLTVAPVWHQGTWLPHKPALLKALSTKGVRPSW